MVPSVKQTRLEELNGRHRGETIFVIGAGPQLAQIQDAELRELGRRVTIGVNMTFYRVRLGYFLSAYIGQVLLAKHRAPETTLLHMRPVYEPPLAPGIISLRRIDFNPAKGLTNRFSGLEPTLFTKLNVALGAGHLALVLGARRIAYIGVEQRNQLHFWNFDQDLRRTILEDIKVLRDVPFLNVDHDYSNYESFVAKLNRTQEDCAKNAFYKVSHVDTFRAYLTCFREAGIEVVSTVADSVVCDAGAPYVPLSELLD